MPTIQILATAPLLERFWAKVQKGDGCWSWTAALDRRGYGVFGIWDGVRGVPSRAHRVAWTIAFGAIPAGMHVCHSCDNPRCVRPDHLFLGTDAANLADMRAKGRGFVMAPQDRCGAGHSMTGHNLKIKRSADGKPSRHCRACDNASARRRRAQWGRERRDRCNTLQRERYHRRVAELRSA